VFESPRGHIGRCKPGLLDLLAFLACNADPNTSVIGTTGQAFGPKLLHRFAQQRTDFLWRQAGKLGGCRRRHVNVEDLSIRLLPH